MSTTLTSAPEKTAAAQLRALRTPVAAERNVAIDIFRGATIAGMTPRLTGVLRPTLTSQITQHVSRREQGVVLGLTQSLNSTSSIISPMIAGFLIGRGDLKTWALGAAAVSLAGFVLSIKSARAGAA